MKKILLRTSIVMTLLIIVSLVIFNVFVTKNVGGTIYIAAVGPMGKNDGLQMTQGIQLYLDKVNQEGGVNGRNVELLVFDDQNDKELAVQKAKEIVEQDQVHVVLGHLYSSTSIQAGEIYKKAKRVS